MPESEKTAPELSEILPLLFSFHQEFVVVTIRRRGTFRFKVEFEMADDPVDVLGIFDKGYNSHPFSTGRTKQRSCFLDFFRRKRNFLKFWKKIL